MKRQVKERTPEEIERLNQKNQQQYSLVAAILWAVCSVVWAVTLVLDVLHEAATLQIVLNVVCAGCTAASSVLHFIRWHRMKKADTVSAEDTLDSEDK